MKIRIIIVCLVLSGCSKNTSENKFNVSFETIDFSYQDGWTYPYSIWINNKGNAFVYYNEVKIDWENTCYIRNNQFSYTDLSSAVLDSLSVLVKNIHFPELDTLYEENCQDCGIYSLRIKNNREVSKIFVLGFYGEEKLENVNKLADYLYFLSKSIIKDKKTIILESKSDGFYLIPPPPIKVKLK
jgi:hypothetical protein